MVQNRTFPSLVCTYHLSSLLLVQDMRYVSSLLKGKIKGELVVLVVICLCYVEALVGWAPAPGFAGRCRECKLDTSTYNCNSCMPPKPYLPWLDLNASDAAQKLAFRSSSLSPMCLGALCRAGVVRSSSARRPQFPANPKYFTVSVLKIAGRSSPLPSSLLSSVVRSIS